MMIKNKKRDWILSLASAAVILAVLIFIDKRAHYSMLASVIQKAAIYSLLAVKLKQRVFRLRNIGIFALTLHRVCVCRLDGAGIIYCFFSKLGRILKCFRIGVPVPALVLDPQVKPEVMADTVLVEFALENAYLRTVAFHKIYLCRRAAHAQRFFENGTCKFIKSHYSAPPLPPIVISFTLMRGCPTFVGMLPEADPHMP